MLLCGAVDAARLAFYALSTIVQGIHRREQQRRLPPPPPLPPRRNVTNQELPHTLRSRVADKSAITRRPFRRLNSNAIGARTRHIGAQLGIGHVRDGTIQPKASLPRPRANCNLPGGSSDSEIQRRLCSEERSKLALGSRALPTKINASSQADYYL